MNPSPTLSSTVCRTVRRLAVCLSVVAWLTGAVLCLLAVAGTAFLESPAVATLCAVANSCLGVATSARILTSSLPPARRRGPGADRPGSAKSR